MPKLQKTTTKKKVHQKLHSVAVLKNSMGLCSIDVFYFLIKENNRGTGILQENENRNQLKDTLK